jgi:DNA-binding CsgD family transcriptional regulator
MLENLCENYGANVGANPINPTHVITNYSQNWQRKYFENKYHLIDPVVECVKFQPAPNFLVRIPISFYRHPLFEEARSFGVRPTNVIGRRIGDLSIICAFLFDGNTSTLKLISERCEQEVWRVYENKIENLTLRQMEVLELSERGLCSKQIAAEMGLSYAAVAKHRRKILKDFDCASFNIALLAYARVKWRTLSSH